MSNKYCNIDGTKKIKDDFSNINIGFDEVEKNANDLQNQISSNKVELLSNINTNKEIAGNNLQSHIGNVMAHAAENITYTGNVSGAEDTKKAVDMLQIQVDNISVEGSIDPEVQQSLLDSEGTNFSTLKERLDSQLNRIKNHSNSDMPHQIKDLDNNKTYRYGLQFSDGKPQFIYEEVI